MKKLLSVILLLLLCNAIAKAAYNAEDSPYAFKFNFSTGEATLLGPKEIQQPYFQTNIEIPKFIYFSGQQFIVTAIGDKAFFNLHGISGSLTIPNSVKSIGKSAFEGCLGLTGSLIIPNSVTSMGAWAFAACSSFDGSLTISNSVTTIGEGAFFGCWGLTGSLTIPNSVTTIEQEAFEGCRGLTGSLIIPNSVTSIGVAAFMDCSGFDGSLTIPNSVTEIGAAAFSGCSGFNGSLTIPNSVTTIERQTFYRCSGFNGSLTIPNSVKDIGESAFQGCNGFTGSLIIPNSVTTIGNSAFDGCSGFTGSLTIPNSVNTIRINAFSGCKGLMGSLTLPGTLTTLETAAFATGSRFSDVTYLTSDPIATGETFSDYSTTLYVYKDGIEKAKTTKAWMNFQNIEPITIAPTSISLNQSEASLAVSNTMQLEVRYYPENAYEKVLTWQSSDESVATVDESGLVTGISPGKAIITATTSGSGLSASCIVTVQTLVESITLNIQSASLEVGETVQLIATVLPENATDKSYIWESMDETIATVDDNGLVTAVSVGETSILARTNSASASGAVLEAWFSLTVHPKVAKSITIDQENVSLNIGETVKLTATVLPDDSPDKSVSWTSSVPGIASVDENGLVTAISEGEATITAITNDGSELTASCTISVKEIFVESIILNLESASVEVGETVQLIATVLPENASYKSYIWGSMDETIATVDDNGLVTAVSAGHTLIYASTTRASANGAAVGAWFAIIVHPKGTESITLDHEEVALNTGETIKLTAIVLPDDAPDKSVTWISSAPQIASVDANGLVTAISDGEAIITATTKSGLSASCTVVVNPILVESVTLNIESASLGVGETVQLIATVHPENATNKSYFWKSMDETIATVDDNGLVTAVSVGETSILARTNSASASGAVLEAWFSLTVHPKVAKSITIDQENVSLNIGETVKLTATVLPDDSPDKSVSWTSSVPGIASVDENGLVTAISEGEATITAITNDGSELTASCTISVKEIFVESIILNLESASVEVGETVQLIATVLPENASYKSYIWGSMDETIATVDDNGLVTAVSAGHTLIYASTTRASANGAAVGAWFAIIVHPKGTESITLDHEEVALNTGETIKLTAIVLPDDAPDKSVTWISSAPQIASVDANGLVTAISDGEAIITATTKSGLSASCTVVVNPILVESVTLNIESASLGVGETVQLIATVHPENATNKSYFWKSMDETIATVDDNGLVTAVSVGETLLLACTYSASASGAVVGAWFHLTVHPKFAESITIDHENISLNVGETVKLNASVLPDDAEDKSFTWSSSNPDIASVDEDGWVTAVKAGDASVTATTADGSDLSAECRVSVHDLSGVQYVHNDGFTIKVVDSSIVIDGLNEGVTTALVSLDGHFLGIKKSENAPVVYQVVPGIYIICIGNQSYKVIVRG